jgi:hypothetical protein
VLRDVFLTECELTEYGRYRLRVGLIDCRASNRRSEQTETGRLEEISTETIPPGSYCGGPCESRSARHDDKMDETVLLSRDMDFPLSRHAEWEISRRGIPLAQVQSVMDDAEQRIVDESCEGRWIYQSRFLFENGKMYLAPVVVDGGEWPPVVITGYRTSKIGLPSLRRPA